MPDMLVKLYDLPDEAPALARSHAFGVCLLYTSDAADE